MEEEYDPKILQKSEEEALIWITRFRNELQLIEKFFVEKLEEKIKDFVQLQAQYISKSVYKAKFRWNIKNNNENCKIGINDNEDQNDSKNKEFTCDLIDQIIQID